MLLNCYKVIPLAEAAEMVELGSAAEVTEQRLGWLDYNA
jgi:hypothetical protein